VLLIGFAAHSNPFRFLDREESLIGIVGITIGMIGVFRGNPVAWWAMTFSFVFITAGSIWMDVDLLLKYGFRRHPILIHAHLLAAACAATLGLLLSNRIRGAFPRPAAPWLQDIAVLRGLLLIVAPILLIAAAIASLMIVFLFATGRAHNERGTSTSLKTLTSAEADFRANDRDWNHVNDFWTGDVAGLYCIVPHEGNGQMIKLIELSIASADSDPLPTAYPPLPAIRSSKAGAWYQALNVDRSIRPPEVLRGPGRTFNTTSFGFVAYPNDFIGGSKDAFIVNADNTVFRRTLTDDVRDGDDDIPGPLKAPGFTDFPDEDELKKHWSKLD
jgi:hypothetical protein